MHVDPNLVPYMEEWTDNTGGMANAIFWLAKNWTSGLNAQGDRLMPDGARWIWNYAPATRRLLVVIPGTKKSYEIDVEKIIEIKDGNREMATYYRPFFEARAYGMNTHSLFGVPIVTWLVTRRVEIVKEHHPNRTPLYLDDALAALYVRLEDKPCLEFPHVRFGDLLVGNFGYERQPLNNAQVKAHSALIQHLSMLATANRPFEEHHMYSYRALVTLIRLVNHAIEPGLYPYMPSDDKIDDTTKEWLNGEMNRLVKLGLTRDAALVDAIAFDRLFDVSWEKTSGMVKALNIEEKN